MRKSMLNFMRGLLKGLRRNKRRRSGSPVSGLENLETRALLAGTLGGHIHAGMTMEADAAQQKGKDSVG